MGCILGSDNIMLYNGSTIHASNLKVGNYIYAYNITSGKLSPQRVSLITISYSSVIEYINGNLGITPTDQPLYIRNSTYTGWINNPMSLKVGEYLYEPMANKWTIIDNITYKRGNFKVYNVYTTGPNTFIVNNFLTDIKQLK